MVVSNRVPAASLFIILLLLSACYGGLVRFQEGFSYMYEYEANITLHQVDTVRVAAKVSLKPIDNRGDSQELKLDVTDFTLQSTKRAAPADHRPDFSRWFSFLISDDGNVGEVLHAPDEDLEILTVKKSVVGLFAGQYLNKEKSATALNDGWSYTSTEIGNEGHHSAMYRVIPLDSGHKFTKTRVLYEHPLKHAEANMEKTTFIDKELGTIYSVFVRENVTAKHTAKTKFDPYFNMRKVDAVTDFDQIEYPDIKAFTTGKLLFINRQRNLEHTKRPPDLVFGQLHMTKSIRGKPARDVEHTPDKLKEFIKSNLTCIKKEHGSEGPLGGLDCFNGLLIAMKALPDTDFRNIVKFYLNETTEKLESTVDQNIILDALCAIGTNTSQFLLAKLVLERSAQNDLLVQRALVHVATMESTPSKDILEFLDKALHDSANFLRKFRLPTYHKALLAAGSVAHKLIKEGQTNIAAKLTSRLQDMVGIHDPWQYRRKRALMTEEKQEEYDIHHVILLEALGNGGHDDSYEYILSHLNDTNSPWIKRAGIHALRKYQHQQAAETLLGLAHYDDNEEVRYEAMLQFQSHPRAADKQFARNNTACDWNDFSDTYDKTATKLSRHKRGVFDQELDFKLASPDVDWQKRVGKSAIGASFGVIMMNFLQLKVSPLSGLFRVVVHDEVYARIHLGFLGFNVDFFLARICFKGGTSYDVNIFQEFDPRLNPKNVELVTKSLRNIVGGIKDGIDILTSVIDGSSGDLSMKGIVDDFLAAFRDIPKKILNLRKTAVKLSNELGELMVDQMPPFIQPVKDLVEYASDLMNSVKSDFMDFYNSVVQPIETTIPNAAETIYKSAKSIIETFPKIFKDPKSAVVTIGKAFIRISLSLKQLNMTKTKIQDSFNRKLLTYFENIDEEYEKLTDLVRAAYDSVANKGSAWVNDVLDSEDPIASATDGQMTTSDIKRRVVQNLEAIIEDLYEPFAVFQNLGQFYSDKFSLLFSLISDCKKAYDKLKTGYKQARSTLDTIFGPKCHKEFPREFRVPDDLCFGDGFYPSKLGGANVEYGYKGIDILITSGEQVVAPFSGNVVRTGDNEIKISSMAEMITGTEVIITNVLPREDIYMASDKYAVERKVAAGDQLGTATTSSCGSSKNHIHFAVYKDGAPIDPTRFLLPRKPSPPRWNQICDDYKVVYKFETVDAGTIVGVGGRKEEDTSGHVPDDGESPNDLDSASEPSYDHDGGGMREKLQQSVRRKKRDLIGDAKNMIDILVARTEAFLEQFSVSRITMGNIAEFIELLELEETEIKMKTTLQTIKNILDHKPCKSPDSMTNDELQAELFARGLSSAGERKSMISALMNGDKGCPTIAIGKPETGYMYCQFDSDCLAIQCCLSLRVADLFQKSYLAYAIVDAEELSLTIAFEDWKRVLDIEINEVFEDTVATGLRFELLGMEIIARYRMQITEQDVYLTFGAGVCSSEDLSFCVVYANVIEDAIFTLPKLLNNGTVIKPKVDWEAYLNLESVQSKFQETGTTILNDAKDAAVDKLYDILQIPKEFLQNNQRCLIPENLPEPDLYDALHEKGLSTNGSRSQLEQRLHIADRTCSTTFGNTLTFPSIENETIRRNFYYTVSKDCMRIDACLDVTFDGLSIEKTFSAYIALDPCHYTIKIGIEKWTRTMYLIDFVWAEVKKVKLTELAYLSFMLDKIEDTKEFVLDVELVIEMFEFRSKFIQGMKIPIPGCNGNFTIPGKGDLTSLAETIGGQLSREAFETFLSSLDVKDIVSEQQCQVTPDSSDCETDINDFIPDSLKSTLHCKMLDKCWGVQCCIEFTFDIPLSAEAFEVSLPFMFRFDPCEYFVEARISKHEFKEWFLEYNWGIKEYITIGKKESVSLSYDVKKFEEGFTVDVEMSICFPLSDDDLFCVPHSGALHLIENEHIPACLDQLDEIRNLSLTELLQERGKEIGDHFGESGRAFLTEKFDLNNLLLKHSCDRKRHPFSPTVNGWNIACSQSIKRIPTLPNFMACHIDETCTHIVCCIDIDVIGLSLKFDIDLNLCENTITAGFEDVTKSVENALSDYEWGKEKQISLRDVLKVKYKIQKSGRATYIVHASVAACFETKGDCLINTTLFDNMEIPRRLCTFTNESCMVVNENITHECAMDVDCQGITCDIVWPSDLETSSFPVSLRIDSCNPFIILEYANKKWKRSLSSVVSGNVYSQATNESSVLKYSVEETATNYRVSLNITLLCNLNCIDTEVLTDFPLRKLSCKLTSKRRKRNDFIVDGDTGLSNDLKELIKQHASSQDIEDYIQSFKDANKKLRHDNLQPFSLAPSDAETTIMSKLKSLGQNNFMSIPFFEEEQNKGFTINVEGAEAIMRLLEDSADIFDNIEKTFVIGKGLTRKGVHQLGRMLANMTIGDLEALLDLNNIDPVVIHDLITDLIDLATTLYSETIDAITSGEISNAFESFDVVLRGYYKFPPVTATLFKIPPVPFFLGPVIAYFEFGAGCVYGIDAGVGLRVMNMVAEASVVPKGGAYVYGGLSFCLGPFCAELRLGGYIMNLQFPTTAEVMFSKFPLDVGLRMDLHLIPLRLVLAAQVTISVKIPFCCQVRFTIWRQNIWSYSTPLINKSPLFHLTTEDKDPDPPEFKAVLDEGEVKRFVATRYCEVVQLPNIDYSEPAFQIAVAASDSLSQVTYYLDVGTYPGGSDVLSNERLGGALTKLSRLLTPTGVPLYFTMYAENSQGSRSSVTCDLRTYDVTVPSGRFEADFETTSNPDILSASVVVQDDSPITEAYVGIGFGKWVYGDQIKRFTEVDLEKRDTSVDTGHDPHNLRTLEHFTGMQNGRLIGEILTTKAGVHKAGDCARLCLDRSEYSCLSINYDYGTSGLCELMKSIEGHDYKIAQDGLFSHYERLGTGHAVEFTENELNLQHNFLYDFNLDLTNSLKYRHVITTSKGILADFTTPEPGLIMNGKADYLETVPCLDIIPEDRPDWEKYCIGTDHSIPNHRVVLDGEGSESVFNGREPLTDMKYTRINNYISANWNGFRDNETNIRGYTFAVGHDICEDLLHPHHDPHRHLLSEEHWTNRGQIYPIPPPYTRLPDGQYFITVRALNKVMYGGPLSVTVCHTTPYIVDSSAPFVHEIFDLRYDEKSFYIYGTINISDPHSGIAEYDLCLGKTSRSCDLLPWYTYDYASTDNKIEHRYRIPDGVPAWIRVKAVNNVLLSTVGVADQAIIVDSTGPFAGTLYDGSDFKSDLQFSKDETKICFNWFDFYDPESGIAYYLVGAGTKMGSTDIVKLTKMNGKQHSTCLDVSAPNTLKHGMTYYGVVWAFNGAINQRNISAVSNGVLIDLSPPEPGAVVDGILEHFEDLEYSSSKSSVSLQWDKFSDPESGIKQHDVKISKQSDQGSQTLQDWTSVSNSDQYASWNNFHHHHRDIIRSSLRVTNGALNDVTLNTNGVLIDLTAPVVKYLTDGSIPGTDLQFQSDDAQISCTFEFNDDESGIAAYKFQVYEQKNGNRKKIWPKLNDWEIYTAETLKTSYENADLQLQTGAIYSIRVGVSNRAGVTTIHETDGVKLDLTKPEIMWLHVGVFHGETEDIHNGYVYQADHDGMKVSFLALDLESGVVGINIRVGTSPGSDDIKLDTYYGGKTQDIYITSLALTDTDTSVMAPVYYVTVAAYNGAGERSEDRISSPVVVLPEDVPGIVSDGIAIDDGLYDIDYDRDSATASLSFSGFKSTIHGISTFEWAVGTKPGLEDVQPYTELGLSSPDDSEGRGFAQMPLYLNHGETYFTTVRGITNAGNVLESSSNGFVVDLTAGNIAFDSIAGFRKESLENETQLYLEDAQLFDAEWHYSDEEYKTEHVQDNIESTWFSMGTFPFADDIHNMTYQAVSPLYVGRLPTDNASLRDKGLPNIINVYTKNKAGQVASIHAPAVVEDKSAPTEGIVSCPDYIQPKGLFRCNWNSFVDNESPIVRYTFSLGTAEGSSDLIPGRFVSAEVTWFEINAAKLALTHAMTLYATVGAQNIVGLATFQFSNKIIVDSSPPSPGIVVELSQDHIVDEGKQSDAEYATCFTESDCRTFDAVCQESLVSLAVAWQQFLDGESGITQYQLAIGLTKEGTEIQDFETISVVGQSLTYTVSGINLFGAREVFAKIKAFNGAGLSTVSTSNGVYISYMSQGLPPLSPIGVWDADPIITGDIDYQTDITTIRAAWDVTGDPCPVAKYEWAIERLDGKLIQDFVTASGYGIETNDQQHFQHGEVYYSLLRVTNALEYQYTIRSNGVTIHNQPLAPGSVYDGDILGYDLSVIDSKTSVTCNWNDFGVTVSETVESVLTGNLGVNGKEAPENQQVSYYEVGLGSDRRYSHTKDDVAAFRNVEKATFVTFNNLELIPGHAVYYCTVRAYSSSLSTASVTSNGFSVSFNGGVTANELRMPRYITSDSEMSVQWNEFHSEVDMLLYYVAISDEDIAEVKECKSYIESTEANETNATSIFNVLGVKNVALNTHVALTDLHLEHGKTYYVYAIGVDLSGECNMTVAVTTVDLTPPGGGQLTAGPYYDMKLAFTPFEDSISVKWTNFEDAESGIESYELSLWQATSCKKLDTLDQIGDSVRIGTNVQHYKFRNLEMSRGIPFIVKMNIFNNAGLLTNDQTSPILYDSSIPEAGKVVEGINFRDDVVWWGETDNIEGTFLHFPSDSGLSCPLRSISLNPDDRWSLLDIDGFQQPDGRYWELSYLPSRVIHNKLTETLKIKLSRDTKHDQMLTGAAYRSADMENGGIYQLQIKAADGNGLAVTEIMFLDGTLDKFHTYNYVEEPDWTTDLCSCCSEAPVPDDCPCSDCDTYLESISERSTSSPSFMDINTESSFPTETTTVKGVVNWKSLRPIQTFSKQKGCGLQIINGPRPFIVVWCRFYNNSNRDMETRSDLHFDPSAEFHSYKMAFSISKEDIYEALELEVTVDDRVIQKFSGIPYLSTTTKFFIHVWNRDNYIPELSDVFNNWVTEAEFKDLIFPPSTGELCRYGHVFESGSNPIVRYEAGVGTDRGSNNVQPFTEVLRPCIPCTDECSILHCDPQCPTATKQLTFRLGNINLEGSFADNNETNVTTYYLAVKAVLSSGEYTIAYSDGFYIDTTPPAFDTRVFMYIDVDQSDYTPVEFQGSNSTIKSLWLCTDEESDIENYDWAIGSFPGGTDIQEFRSTGNNPTGKNENLDDVLKHKRRYYVSVKCTNEAGLTTLFEDLKGVEVLLDAPDVDEVGGEIIGAESFDSDVNPPDSKWSDSHGSVGGSWNISNDPSVREYDFCVGSSKDNLDDIFRCLWVGYNESGNVDIKDGYLFYAGQKLYSLKEIGQKTTDGEEPGMFKMETGRVLYPSIRICNRAVKCSKKSLGSITITSAKSDMQTARENSTLIFTVSKEITKRATTASDIIIQTPDDLNSGQTVIVSLLTEEELTTDYGSDASDNFLPYIVNPNATKSKTERLLRGRIQDFISSFSVTSVGQAPMPGPLLVSFPKSSESRSEEVSLLIHWNPDHQEWQISSRTCVNSMASTQYNNETQVTTVMVCDTRNPQPDSYFAIETQFAIVSAKASLVNNAPILNDIPVLTMKEDEGTLELQLFADDPDGDEVEFYLLSSVGDYPLVAMEMDLQRNGFFSFTPCSTCFGTVQDIKIMAIDKPETPEIKSTNTTGLFTIEVQSVNTAPVIFMVSSTGDYMLHPDQTEKVIIWIENRDAAVETFSAVFGAYDLDTNDDLSLFKKISANGSVVLTQQDPSERDKYFECNSTMCLNTVPKIHPNQMSWILSKIDYEQNTTFTGIESMQFVVQDSAGTYSDPITIEIVVMEMPCLHGGECLVTSSYYTCSDVRRISDFFANYDCICPSNWKGQRCQEDVNECELSPCGSAFTCNNVVGSYECHLASYAFALIVLALVILIVFIILFVFRKRIMTYIRSKRKAKQSSTQRPESKYVLSVSNELPEILKMENIRRSYAPGSTDRPRDRAMLNRKPCFKGAAAMTNAPIEEEEPTEGYRQPIEVTKYHSVQTAEPETDTSSPSYKSMLNQRPRLPPLHPIRVILAQKNTSKPFKHPKPRIMHVGDDTIVPPMTAFIGNQRKYEQTGHSFDNYGADEFKTMDSSEISYSNKPPLDTRGTSISPKTAFDGKSTPSQQQYPFSTDKTICANEDTATPPMAAFIGKHSVKKKTDMTRDDEVLDLETFTAGQGATLETSKSSSPTPFGRIPEAWTNNAKRGLVLTKRGSNRLRNDNDNTFEFQEDDLLSGSDDEKVMRPYSAMSVNSIASEFALPGAPFPADMEEPEESLGESVV